MPELSDKHCAELAADLTQLKADLEVLLHTTESGTKPVKLKDNQGRLSRMDELHNQSILVANRTVAENRLKQVNAAIRRLDEGLYGVCRECDEPIAFPRLKAYPDASLCIECQNDLESS